MGGGPKSCRALVPIRSKVRTRAVGCVGVRLGVEVDTVGLIWSLSKKVLILKFLWKVSRSLLRSPMLGSPGVGQKFSPLSNSVSSVVERDRSERLTTVVGDLSMGSRTLFLK